MSPRTSKKPVSTIGVTILVALSVLVLRDVSSTVAEKLAGIASYGADDFDRVVEGTKAHPALFDPIVPPAPTQNSVVGVCQSTDAELGGLSAPLNATLSYEQVDSITRLAVQRAGGLDAIVNPGDWVAIKPNILFFPGQSAFGYQTMIVGSCTDLRAVRSLIQQLVEEGDASRITIAEGGDWWNIDYALPPALDGIQTEDGWTATWPHYGNLSYEDIVADFDTLYPGITFDMVDLNYPPYTTDSVPGGGLLADTYTMPDVLNCDVLIPVASMKTHNTSRITCIHKNYVGVAPGAIYARAGGFGQGMNKSLLPHGDNIEKVLIDLVSYHPADFSIVECFWGMEGEGPDQGSPIKRNVVLASRDPVALDVADAYVMGMNPWDIDHLHWSHNKGFGTFDLDYITVHGPDLDDVRYEFVKASRGPGFAYYLGRGNRIWLVNGTYDGSTDLDAEQLGAGVETTISPVPGQMTQGMEWTVAQFTDVREYCDLSVIYGGTSNCVSYAFTRLVADTAQTAYLRFGGDDGMKIWLNGLVIYNQPSVGGGGWSKVEDGVPVNLTAGVNTILLKISNTSGGYGFSLITTESNADGDTPLGIEYRVTPVPPPDIPVLIRPPDRAVLGDNTPTFDWSGTAGSGGTYTLEFAADSEFTFVVIMAGLTDTTYEDPTPFMDGDYYWHVQAIDQAGHESGYQSSLFMFTVGTAVPPVPILLLPLDSSFTCDTTPTFTWMSPGPALGGRSGAETGSAMAGAAFSPVTYTLQYSADPLFAQATTVVGIADATYTVSETGAMPYGTCYWRVEAVDEADHHSGYQADAFRFGVFVAGDQNQDSLTTSADVIYLVNFVFKGGATPQPCEAAGDSNCDGSVTSSDIIYQVNYVFKGGPPPCNVGALIADGTWSCP